MAAAAIDRAASSDSSIAIVLVIRMYRSQKQQWRYVRSESQRRPSMPMREPRIRFRSLVESSQKHEYRFSLSQKYHFPPGEAA